jgi:hypothetical protein
LAKAFGTGEGRKLTYTRVLHARILAEAQREPDRKADQAATWSLMTLRATVRKTDLPRSQPKPFARCCEGRPRLDTSTEYVTLLAKTGKWSLVQYKLYLLEGKERYL